jgi:membrane protein required for colicin V production
MEIPVGRTPWSAADALVGPYPDRLMPTINWIDIVLAVVLLLSTLGGLRKGFSREIIGLAAALIGLLLAFQFHRMAGQPLKPYISQEGLSSVAGFLIIFFAVLILGAILSSIVRRILKTVGLSGIDRLVGGLYGLLRGSLISIAIIVALSTFTSSKAVVQSRMAPYLVEASGMLARIVPRGLEAGFQHRYEQMKSSWKLAEQKN